MITLTNNGGRWIASAHYDDRHMLKSAGFRWDLANRYWWTSDLSIAAKFSENAAKMARATIDASRAQTSDIGVPVPSGLQYLPFQKAGIAFAATRPGVLIADEMGLGKTIQALGAINADPSIRNVLAIVPASLKLNWSREARKWLARPFIVSIADSVTFYRDPVRANFVIINYDVLRKQRPQIDTIEWDLLICDESHYLKNPKALRTHMVFGVHKPDGRQYAPIHARRRLFLTGTPILNRPIELWPLVRSLDPNGLGRSKHYFETRYCGAHNNGFGWDTTGATNLGELQQRLRSSIMVRRLKADVMTELPPKRRQIIVTPVSAKNAKDAIARERTIERQNAMMLLAARREVEQLAADQASEAYKEAARALRKLRGVAFERIAKVRHETALVKVPDVVQHCLECLESVQQIVIWAHHHDVVDAIVKGLAEGGIKRVATADGRDSITKRDQAEQAFRSDPTVRAIVCSIQGFGEGHNLQNAAHEVFAEMDWTPGKMCQAEDRCHRHGQQNSVLIQHVVLDGSLDGRMVELLVAKQAVIDAGLDAGTEPLEVTDLGAA